MNTLIKFPDRAPAQSLPTDCTLVLEPVEAGLTPLSLIAQEVVEGWLDGVLVLTQQGTIVYSNRCARQICQQLVPSSPPSEIPHQVWRICEALIDSREVFPEHRVVLDDDIATATVTIRVRARWVDRLDIDQPYLLVTLEDRSQSLKNVAIAEARKYHLTPREAEVWLLRRANRTYKAIAAELHIAIDTVKKHIKNIHAKRDATRWAEEGVEG